MIFYNGAYYLLVSRKLILLFALSQTRARPRSPALSFRSRFLSLSLSPAYPFLLRLSPSLFSLFACERPVTFPDWLLCRQHSSSKVNLFCVALLPPPPPLAVLYPCGRTAGSRAMTHHDDSSL